MAYTNKVFFISLLILMALLGVSVGKTVHKVGDSQGWTMMGVDYESWASSKTFQVGDSLVFAYDNGFHDLTQVTHDDFVLCDSSKPITRYETGFDTITLTKPGIQYFICGTPGHCNIGQKLQVHVMPASLGHVAAPVPVPVQSPTSSSSPAPSPVNKAPEYHLGPSPVQSPSSLSSPVPSSLADSSVNNAPKNHMGPSPAPVSASPAPVSASQAPVSASPAPVSSASNSVVWMELSFVPLVYLLILV